MSKDTVDEAGRVDVDGVARPQMRQEGLGDLQLGATAKAGNASEWLRRHLDVRRDVPEQRASQLHASLAARGADGD